MKTSFPLNPKPGEPLAGAVSLDSAFAKSNRVPATVMNAVKVHWSVIQAMAVVMGYSFGWAIGVTAADSETQGKTGVFVPGVMGNAFYVSMECGIRAEAAKYGFKVDIQGAPQFDPSLQTPIVNAVVAAKPAGLLIAPTDSKAMFVPISQAVDSGIKVALVDTTLDDTSKVITAIATDNTAGGAAAADALAKLIGEKGEVMAIAFQAGASTSDQRQKGFEGRSRSTRTSSTSDSRSPTMTRLKLPPRWGQRWPRTQTSPASLPPTTDLPKAPPPDYGSRTRSAWSKSSGSTRVTRRSSSSRTALSRRSSLSGPIRSASTGWMLSRTH